jgi:hypothetical protein
MRWEDVDRELLFVAGVASVISSFLTVYLILKGVKVIEN